jgi:hypothetical protein
MIRLRIVVPPDLKREKFPVVHWAATVSKNGIVFLQTNDRAADIQDLSSIQSTHPIKAAILNGSSCLNDDSPPGRLPIA